MTTEKQGPGLSRSTDFKNSSIDLVSAHKTVVTVDHVCYNTDLILLHSSPFGLHVGQRDFAMWLKKKNRKDFKRGIYSGSNNLNDWYAGQFIDSCSMITVQDYLKEYIEENSKFIIKY